MNTQLFWLCPLVRPFAYFISDCATRTCMRFGSHDFFPSPSRTYCNMRLLSLLCTRMIYIHNLKGFIKYGAFLYSLQASISSVNLKLAPYIQPSTMYNKSQHLKLYKSQNGSDVTSYRHNSINSLLLSICRQMVFLCLSLINYSHLIPLNDGQQYV
jgi:hypothetical protein